MRLLIGAMVLLIAVMAGYLTSMVVVFQKVPEGICEADTYEDYFLIGYPRTPSKEPNLLIVEPPVLKETVEVKVVPVVIGYDYRLEQVETINLYATCYSKWDDSTVAEEVYGTDVYAIYSEKELPYTERVPSDWHYTVAMNKTMDRYVRDHITLPDGQRTWRYRFHVPYYNKGKNDEMSDRAKLAYHGYLREFNAPYFSVPRDRMPNKRVPAGDVPYSKRIDVLLTGCPARCHDKATDWQQIDTKGLPIEVWEIQKFAIYSDGTEKRVEYVEN